MRIGELPLYEFFFFFSSRRRHTRSKRDWSSDVCSSDLHLMADPIWWFYLYWLPKFLDAKYGIKLAHVALPLIAVYLVADVGSIAGGWLSSRFMKRGWTANRARKTAMLLMALVIVPTALAPRAGSMWTAVLIVSVAAAAHQGWSANVYTLASDMFPRSAVASISGIGGFAGAMGGVLFQRAT